MHKRGALFLLPLYEKIDTLCKSHGITVTELCRRIGISRALLSDYKAGRIKNIGTSALQKIADFFTVSVDYLLGNEKLPVILSDDGQREYDEIFNGLSADTRAKWLELGRLFLDAQRNNEKK
jgi:transcriptional regulator with XRE-family HTH domain